MNIAGHTVPRRYLYYLTGFAFVVFCLNAYHRYEPFTFANYDPGWMVHATTSLVHDGDLNLSNQLSFNPAHLGGQVALGARGEWFPIHEPLISLIAVPFYILFDIPGFLICNILLCTILVAQTALCSARVASSSSALISALLFMSSPLMDAYSYSFSTDVLGACFVVAALAGFIDKKFSWCGFWCGIAVIARITTFPAAAVIALFVLVQHMQTGGWRVLWSFLKGVATPIFIFFGFNWFCFDDPLTLPYMRQAVENASGVITVAAQSVYKPQDVFLGMRNLFTDRSHGFFIGMPVLILALPLGIVAFLHSSKKAIGALIGAILCAQIIFTAYYGGFPGAVGNRYLFASYAVSVVITAVAIDYIWRRSAHREGDSHE